MRLVSIPVLDFVEAAVPVFAEGVEIPHPDSIEDKARTYDRTEVDAARKEAFEACERFAKLLQHYWENSDPSHLTNNVPVVPGDYRIRTVPSAIARVLGDFDGHSCEVMLVQKTD